VVGLEGSTDLLEEIQGALNDPVFPVGLGRRACVPDTQVVIGVSEKPLLDALKSEKWHARQWYRKKYPKDKPVDLSIDCYADVAGDTGDDAGLVSDLPLSFSQRHRQYTFRAVKTVRVEGVTNDQPSHDAFGGAKEMSK
jgi:CRISPR system Cascade subunit CasD